MFLNIKLPDGMTMDVKCHRVLLKTYPKLELYVHYAVKESDVHYSTDYFTVSTKDGFSVGNRAHRSVNRAVNSLLGIIDRYGEDKVIERNEEMKGRLANVS